MSKGLQAQLDRATRQTVKYHLDTLGIPPDSEVGKFVLREFHPDWPDGVPIRDLYNPEAIFDFLTEFEETS